MSIRRPCSAATLLTLFVALSSFAQVDLDVPIDKIQLGNVVHGPAITLADFNGKVVLLEAWSMTDMKSQTSMATLNRWHDELGSFGLLTVAAHNGEVKADELKAKSKSLGIKFTVLDGAFVKPGSINLPHVYLFDHAGKCIYRGAPADAETKVRAAVGAKLADLGQPAKSKAVAALVEGLKKGQPPTSVLPKVVPLVKAADKETAEEAQKLLDRLTEAGLKKLELAEKFVESDPIEAFLAIETVPADFKGTPVAVKAATMLAALRKDKAVIEEQKAKPVLESVRKLDAVLAKQAAGKDPKEPAFQKQNAATLASLRSTVQQMTKTYPKARATQEATQIADKYGVTIK